MSNTERKRVLNYRNDNGLAPNPDNIDYGEIAIGYKKDNEAIYIKTTANDIVDFTPISIVNINYNKLKELRDNSKLKPSQYYRITDFVTTVANDPEARSAGHPFDIIVMASEKDKLQEECYAIQHEDDTYFANCNLAAWKIWYCLDNNTTKYMWADTANGKGVIYHMIDEWGNDCPYDFKNVQFKRYAVKDISLNGELADLDGTYIGYNSSMNGLNIPDQDDFTWVYTFTYGYRNKEEIIVDASNIGFNSEEDYGLKGYYGDNIIKPSVCHIVNDEETSTPFCLNNIVWYDVNSWHHGSANNIIIESECINMTLSGNAHHIGYDNRNLIMGTRCISNTIGSGGNMNTFGDRCSYNTFGNNCGSNTFGYNCFYNTFGNECFGNTFGNNCDNNTFGDGCNNNTFGGTCNNNTFGNNCYSNTFKDSCSSNKFGNNCGSNTFGNGCRRNTFGNDCNGNTFGNECNGNTFGNECDSNKFGIRCESNTFGNECYSNKFKDSCRYNAFGNECHDNKFGNNCSTNTFGNYCSYNLFSNDFLYNTLGNDLLYIAIPTEKIYHAQILNGTRGVNNNNKLTIEFTPETTYSQFAGLTSDNVLKTWVEADDPHDGVDCGNY